MDTKQVDLEAGSEKSQQIKEENRQAFIDLMAEIIVDISIAQYHEEKSRQKSK